MNNSKFKNVHTMIGPDAKINGPIKLDQGLIIYGKVYGSISTNGPVRVAKNALVEGDIHGANIRIGGIVKGSIFSQNQVVLRKTCKLEGDISYRNLHIEDGAQFQGQCDLIINTVKKK